MTSDRLGVITVFGILVPGAYLGGVLAMATSSVIELSGGSGHADIGGFISRNTGLAAGVFLFVAYLLGIILRLFAPDIADGFSTRYFHITGRGKHAWVNDKFPYQETVASRLERDGLGYVPALMSRINVDYARAGNTAFFNYCKWFVGANCDSLSKQLQQAEALTRFLSGTLLVLGIAFPVAVLLCVAFALHRVGSVAGLYGVMATIDLVCLVLILERIKFQRRTEVILLWSSVYLIVNGGILAARPSDRKHPFDSIFFPAKEDASGQPENRSGDPSDPGERYILSGSCGGGSTPLPSSSPPSPPDERPRREPG